MTAQNGAVPPAAPPVDPGNPFVLGGPVPPVQWTTTSVPSSAGPLTLLTLRTAGTTLSVLLPRESALELARMLRNNAQQTASGLIVPPGAGELS